MKNIALFLLMVAFVSCRTESDDRGSADMNDLSKTRAIDKQLNITILLDLSDRIDLQKYPTTPEHYERDLAIVQYFTEIFVQDMKKRGTFMAKGKLRVIFSPKPNDPNVNFYAENLNVDLSKMDNKQKKEVYENLSENFMNNLSPIYQTTLENNRYVGSDIWRFFKNDVQDYCIDRDSSYRNILVVLTDGYIDHIDSRDQEKNRYTYLLPNLIKQQKLRGNPKWKEVMEQMDFGLITRRRDLQNLEVLMLEITPDLQHKNDEDIIKAILAKWFEEMNVSRFVVHNTDLPEYTKRRIDDFIK